MGHTRTMATPGALAVTVLTEFISRACVPPNQKLFFLAVTKNLLGVIHGVLKAGGGSLSGGVMAWAWTRDLCLTYVHCVEIYMSMSTRILDIDYVCTQFFGGKANSVYFFHLGVENRV